MARAHRVAFRLLTLLGAMAGALLALSPVRADPVSVVNRMRTEGCRGQPAAGSAVTRNTELDAVARELPRRSLGDAIARTGYPAASSVSFHTRGSADDATVRSLLTASHCASVNDTRFEEIGVFQRGDETWIVLASRHVEETITLNAAEVAQRVLDLVNEARREPRSCGRDRFEAAPPLRSSDLLGTVALGHAEDIARRQNLTHEGGDGSQSADRIRRAGYDLLGSGENVAAGQRSADAVVAAWLASPGHCVNIMEPRFTEMGVAFALAPPGSNPAIYWVQVFATPR